MKCPKCGGELAYEEDVDGTYVYPIIEGVVQWNNGELKGDCHGHRLCCRECGYELPEEELSEVLSKSME